jgi:hypothetical protein
MQKTGILVTILLLLCAILLPWSDALAATDGIYQLSEVIQPSWDGTSDDRTATPTAGREFRGQCIK